MYKIIIIDPHDFTKVLFEGDAKHTPVKDDGWKDPKTNKFYRVVEAKYEVDNVTTWIVRVREL